MIANDLQADINGKVSDWNEVWKQITDARGKQCSVRGDDRFVFWDGSQVLVRGLQFVAGRHASRNMKESTSPEIRIEPEQPEFCGDIKPVIKRLSFRVAASMPEIPHEYTLRLKTQCDADYVALYDCIMRDGQIGFWCGVRGQRSRSKPTRYLNPGDGYWYWSMSARRTVKPYHEGRHPLWLSHHINRCTEADWIALVSRGGVVLAGEQTDENDGAW